MRRALLALVLGVLLAACGAAPGSGAAPTAPTDVPPPATPAPTALTVTKLGIAAQPLYGMTREADGSIEVPPVQRPNELGWYELGVRPGDVGPAVVLGHVSGRPAAADHSVPGVFAELDQMAPGDVVTVHREDGSAVDFKVVRVAAYSKADMEANLSDPKDVLRADEIAREIYGDTAGPELRLITCGGRFDPGSGHYDDNLVVYATRV